MHMGVQVPREAGCREWRARGAIPAPAMMCMEARMPRVQDALERLYLHGPGQPLDRFPVSPSPCRQKKTPPGRGLILQPDGAEFGV